MTHALRWFRAESYKLLHSPLLLVHLLVPLLGIAVMLAYYAVSAWDEATKVSAYLQILSMAFPVLLGVIASMTAEREARAGAFQMALTAPLNKFTPHATSIAVLLIYGFCSTVLAVCGFGALFRFMGFVEFSLAFYLKASAVLFLGICPLYFLQYLVGFIFGKGACIGLGIVGSLLCALLITGLGDIVWTFLPWGIGIRFVSALTAHPNGLFLSLPGVVNALCVLVVSGIALVAIMAFWSKTWEGRKNEED